MCDGAQVRAGEHKPKSHHELNSQLMKSIFAGRNRDTEASNDETKGERQ